MHSPSSGPNKTGGSLKDLLLYFLKLGATGFGGPVVLAEHMQRDLVETRGWISKESYVEGFALAQLAPGPLAAQLAIYLGWAHSGILGATLVGICFILPSFIIVLGLAALYLRFGGLRWIQGLFYGIGAAVIAIMTQSSIKLVRKTIKRDWLLISLATTSTLITIITESEILWVFLVAGIAAMLVKAPPKLSRASSLSIIPIYLLSGLNGSADSRLLVNLGLYFLKAGAFVFGSGLAIVPFLHGGVVQHYHWLNERQFLDAVAVAMITPGPVVITSAFIGYLVAGPVGAVIAALGVFLPCYFFVVFPAPYYRRFAQNKPLKAFISGVTAAAIGAISGAVVVLGRRAIIDIPSALIGITTFIVILKVKKVPEILWILVAGLIGLALHTI
jgi:chromate transporter